MYALFNKGKVYEKYFGIPYATPPLGELRFTKPIPSPPWQGILEAVSFAKGCMETANDTNTSEDCLYLNVYVPGMLPPMLYLYLAIYSCPK